LVLGLSACDRQPAESTAKVHIRKSGAQYTLYRNGKPYIIKGASGYTHLDILKQKGGNTIRTWDTTGLASVLESANANGMTVIVGLPIPESRHMSFYNDSSKTNTQYKAIKRLVDKYKSNPAILMWCVGNELSFPYKISYNTFYTAFNDIVSLIHQSDPDHPVTTTIVNFQRKDIFNIKMRTEIDLISFNIFGRLRQMQSDLKSFAWFYDDPYLITEWAIDGPWEGTPFNAWDAYLEFNSTQKAYYYAERYDQDMPVKDPRFLGSFLFYWGQKQEVTSTWFSLFDQDGHQTEAIATAEKIWKGKKSAEVYPQIKNLLLDQRKGGDNIIFEAHDTADAELIMEPGTAAPIKLKWEIYQEDWYKKDNVNNSKGLAPVTTDFKSTNPLKVSFSVPLKEGPYRLFVTAYNADGNVANANIPFYISGVNEKK